MTPLVDTPFWAALAAYGSAPALVSAGSSGGDGAVTVSYADLADRVTDVVRRLGPVPRLVQLEARNDVETVVGYLACLVGRHPVLVVERGSASAGSLAAAYDPDVVLGDTLEERRPGTAHDLHPDLAALMSTSGSTGSPKLVRLSRTNIASNAGAIAAYLQIRPTDVAATALPLHYCYGLSVLTSHLAAGAAVALTELSVIDPGFWELVRERRVTTFPGVPHTFDLLERAGFASMGTPSLRYLTCAGGRLPPDQVRRFADLGQARGFDLFVMYGATEATARMSYLPPDLARTHPSSIGIPIPGGSFEVETDPSGRTVTDAASSRHECGVEPSLLQVGELVYRGDNVMLGYAETPADLARGRDITELRTGDVARFTPDGLVEIVGRRARIAKVFGLRVDLSRVEATLLRAGVVAYAADGGDRVVVAVDRSAAPVDEHLVMQVLGREVALPLDAFTVHPVDGVPRLASGKPDYVALAALPAEVTARTRKADGSAPHHRRLAPAEVTVRRVVGDVLRVDHVADSDSFVSLGGDSLSYVSMSLRLEQVLGHLPPCWHRMTVTELAAAARPAATRTVAKRPAAARRSTRTASRSDGSDPQQRRFAPAKVTGRRGWGAGARRSVQTETNVLLRAAAIVMIVGSHANLFTLLGGAHLLVALVGFNFGRFQVTDRSRTERTRALTRSITRIAVPSVLWLGFAAATSWKYGWENVLLLNGVLGSREWTESWHYWFIEALVWTLVALTLLLAVPAVDRLERRHAFWFPMGLAAVALLSRYDVVRLFGGDHIHRAHVLFWLFALGWAAVKAPTHWHRLLVSVVVVATVPGFFDGGQHAREAAIVVGMLLLTWLPSVRVPSVVARMCGVLASASLYIYLVHWQIYPAYEFKMPWLATGLSLAAGIVFWWVVTQVTPVAERALGGMRERQRWLSHRRYPPRDVHTAPARGPLSAR